MEDDVAELAQIALLGRDFDGATLLAADAPPTAQVARYSRGDGVGLTGDLLGVVLGQPAEIAGHGHGGGPQGARVLYQSRGQAAHQRDEQQRIDGREPEAGEHLEGLQPVQPRPDGGMFGDVLLDLELVEAALRQQGTGDGAQREQEQQHQGGAHRRQGPPGVAYHREQTQKPPDTPSFGAFCVCSRGNTTHSIIAAWKLLGLAGEGIAASPFR